MPLTKSLSEQLTVRSILARVKLISCRWLETNEAVKVLKENVQFNEEDISDLKRDSKEVQHQGFQI